MKQAVIQGVVVLGLLAAPALAQKRVPAFTRPVELEAENLQFKTFAGAEATTILPPGVRGLRTKDGSQVELFDPVQLWRAPQLLGYWQVPDGPSLRMSVVMTGPLELPEKPEDEKTILERPECDALLTQAPPVKPDDPAALSAWLAFFGDGELKGPVQTLPDTIILQKVRAARVESKTKVQIVLLFSVKPGMHGANPERVYAAWIELADKSAPDEAVQAMVRGFLPTIKPTGRPRALAAKPAAKPGAAQAEESPDRVQSRETALRTIRGLPKWWSIETERYIFVSDLAGSERSFVKRLSGDLTRLNRIFEKLIPPEKMIEAVSVVRVFASKKDYEQYVGADYGWTAGLWEPNRRELIVNPSSWMQGKDKKEDIERTVRHHAMNQYLFYALPDAAPWYKAGNAAFIEGMELLPNNIRIGEMDNYARRVKEIIRAGSMHPQDLLKMPFNDFYFADRTEEGISMNFALAWSLVYFLRVGVPSDDYRFATVLPRYEAALRSGKKMGEATDIAFEGISPEALESAWREFWNSDSRRAAAKRLDLFAAAP